MVLGGPLRIERGRGAGSPSWIYRFHEGVKDLLRRSSERDDPEFRRFLEQFRDYLKRRHNERAGIAGAIPLESGESAIRASEDCFLDIDEQGLRMVLDDADDLITLLHSVRESEGAMLELRGASGDRMGAEARVAKRDVEAPIESPDYARPWQDAASPEAGARAGSRERKLRR